nr:hypothetical protein [Pigmentiphaga humi]
MPIAKVRPSSSVLRLRLPASAEMNRLVSTAKAPDMAIPWPVMPSVACRSLAMGVNRLTGRNSEAINAKAQTAKANTPLQEVGSS